MRSAPVQRGRSPEDTATYGADAPDAFTRLRRDALRALAAGPFYRHTLIGPVPPDLRLKLNERWPGDAKRGAAVLAGEIEFSGELVRNPMPVWFPPRAGPGWRGCCAFSTASSRYRSCRMAATARATPRSSSRCCAI